MSVTGQISLKELTSQIKEENLETVIVAFTDHYGRMMGKRYDGDFFLESVIDSGSHACDYLLTTDMEMEPVPGYEFANWELGYGDFHLLPDFDTIRIADWLEKTAIVLCNLANEEHQLITVAPRSILNNQITKLESLGLTSNAATELEYYLFKNSYEALDQENYQSAKPAGWYLEDYHILQGSRTESFTAAARRHLKKSGVPVENSKGEWGKGQHELNVQYTNTLSMADRHIIYKQCLKELADSMGLAVTFMAKIDESQAGSSCHIHISLVKNGNNAFVGNNDFGKVKGSAIFGQFLAGWIKYAPELMVFYAPTINSYKRYVDGSWAPTRLAWSRDNRTAGFRVVGSGSGLRIECRIPGADCNPYLALAASLASGMQGISDELTPPECFEGDVYQASDLPHVPKTLDEAVELFESSEFVKSSFGEDVVSHYAHFYRQEIKAYQKQVSDWERKRYFERI